MSSKTSQSIWETENKKFKEELKNLRSNLKEKDGYSKEKFEKFYRILRNFKEFLKADPEEITFLLKVPQVVKMKGGM